LKLTLLFLRQVGRYYVTLLLNHELLVVSEIMSG